MKILAILLAVSLSASTIAATVTGQVMQFTGRKVETGAKYDYYAIATEKGGRVSLPEWIDGAVLAKIPHQIVLSGDVNKIMCTDMSRACQTASLSNIKSFQIGIGKRLTNAETYTGKQIIFRGVAVTTRQMYSYIAVDTKTGPVSLPNFLDARALLRAEPNAEFSLTGKIKGVICVDMSKACGPSTVSPLSAVSIKF